MTLEKLLNKLIEKGWKPRGENVELYGTSKNTFGEKIVIFIGNAGGFKKWGCTYRELVSKESGLWQFVCENKLYNSNNRGYWGKNVTIVGEYPTLNGDENIGYREYQYYLIESALCNEDKLEKFLLDNIKVEGNEK